MNKQKQEKKINLVENSYRVQKHFPFGGRSYSPGVRELSACESDTAALPPASKWGAQGGRRVGGAGCGARGSQTGGSRLPSLADSSRGWPRASLPSIAQSLHGGKAPAVEPGRQRLAAAGTRQARLGPSALPGSSRSGNPICSDLTDEKKQLWPLPRLRQPRPGSGPASWTLPKRVLFCQLPFIEL